MSETGQFADLGRIRVIIPTYNERENIAEIVKRLRASVPEADVLIVDDNSPDGTGDIADELAKEDSQIEVLHRTEKNGLGAAYLAGFDISLEAGYDVLVEMDADGSHQPEQLDRLLDELRNADIVIGSRYVPGGSVVNWPKSRKILSKGASFYSRTALGLKVNDVTAGYKAFKAATLRSLDLDDVASAGYCFQVDLVNRAIRQGFKVAEVPITFVERERGKSKMSRAVILEGAVKVGQWGLEYRTRGLRNKVKKLAKRKQGADNPGA